jgi:adenosylmethionine-8-amino-7-oxononanoate aminotransferase
VFYAEAGSAAIEIALKLSWHYWRNMGQPDRAQFVVLEHAYHGETIGALSMTRMDLYRQAYGGLLLEPLVAASPDPMLAPDTDPDAVSRNATASLRLLLETHAGKVCAVLLEPLVQCAGGMRMHSPAYLRGVRALCSEFDVHLIADEIAVGLGRTGSVLACDQAGIRPDILCIGKGLTGGTLPLAAVLTSDELYAAFLGEYGSGRAFLHSHSYTGFAIGCAAALATLTLIRESQRSGRMRAVGEALGRAFAPLADHPHVAQLRRSGNILALDLYADAASRKPWPAQQRRGLAVYREALARGVVLRPLGDTLYALPPLSISDEEIALLGRVAAEAIDAAMQD